MGTSKYVAKDGGVFEISHQAKNAVDKTIKSNSEVKRKVKSERKDRILETVDRGLYDIQGPSTFMPKAPWK